MFGALIKQYLARPDRRRGRLADRRRAARPARDGSGAALHEGAGHGVRRRRPRQGPAARDDGRLLVCTGRDNGGVHINSGIPNHAFYLVATALGGARLGAGGTDLVRRADRRGAGAGRAVRGPRDTDGEGRPGALRRRGRAGGGAQGLGAGRGAHRSSSRTRHGTHADSGEAHRRLRGHRTPRGGRYRGTPDAAEWHALAERAAADGRGTPPVGVPDGFSYQITVDGKTVYAADPRLTDEQRS
ncbi:M4 family metallopeptidase [Streptomyces thinghirensis]|nr:M4 family metallopeptidase [Streptomyces thinghirensis]